MQGLIEKLENGLEEIERKIEVLFENNDELREKKELLKTIPGVGEEVAQVFLSEIPDIKDFGSARQLACHAGITPRIRQSGSSVNSAGRISKIGNARLRKILYMPSMNAMRFNPIMIKFAMRLKERGKKGKQIICAVIRKLIHIIYGVLSSRRAFDPNHFTSVP